MRVGLWSFVLGWPTGELAPQLLALTAADTAVHVARGKRSRLGLLLAGASAVGLTHLVRQSRQVQVLAEQSLVDSLGEEYVDRPGERPTTVDLATPWRKLLNPFSRRNPRVRVDKDLRYSDAGKRGLLDIYRPVDREVVGAPVLVQVHGGGWTIGTKEQQGLLLMNRMAERGWVCVAINYRLAPQAPVPGPDRRREEGDRLGPGAHRGVRRRPVVRRDHRRLRRRPPRRAGRADPGRPGVPARLRGRRHPRRRLRAVLRRLRLRRRSPATRRASIMRDRFLAPAGLQAAHPRRGPRGLRARRRRSRTSPPTPPTSSCCTATTTRWSRSSRPARSSTRSARRRRTA